MDSHDSEPDSPPTEAQICKWNGNAYKVWPVRQAFRRFPGVYIYTRFLSGRFHPLYIGEAEDVAHARLEDWESFPELGSHAEHIHCFTVRDGEGKRSDIVRELIEMFNPPLNTDHRTSAASQKISELVPDRWIDVLDELEELGDSPA